MEKILYKNLYLAKEELKSLLKNKAGIYQLVNTINNKSYIGSSDNLNRRLNEYLNPLYRSRNLKKGKSLILNALNKYEPTNFGVKFLELFEFDLNLSKVEKKTLILAKEQHYLDNLNPEYNINSTAGSNLGRTFSKEVRFKMSFSKLGKPGNKKGAILSLESRALFREKSGRSLAIKMIVDNNGGTIFPSIQLASEKTGISRNRISRCARGIRKSIMEKGKIYKFEYVKN